MTDKLSIQEIGEKAGQAAEVLLKKPMDSIISLNKEQEGWLAEVEVVERKSVPDTQDILGRYEMKFDEMGELQGYRRIKLRRRLDREEITDEEV
ncbi:MAG: gas vesicle protein [Methanothrix sp.]|nr:gas vesicle protein [Methanothrix sp.]